MVADAALGGTAREIVLHAISGEHLEIAVVALKRDGDDHLARRMREDPSYGLRQVKAIGGFIEIRDRLAEHAGFVRVTLFGLKTDGGLAVLDFGCHVRFLTR